jgi:hypothetical protein
MSNSAQAANCGRLFKALTNDRLEKYLARAPNRVDCLGLYAWNIALCEAFYPSLHTVEVVLRNSIDAAIAAAYPVARVAKVTSWLDAVPSHLDQFQRESGEKSSTSYRG